MVLNRCIFSTIFNLHLSLSNKLSASLVHFSLSVLTICWRILILRPSYYRMHLIIGMGIPFFSFSKLYYYDFISVVIDRPHKFIFNIYRILLTHSDYIYQLCCVYNSCFSWNSFFLFSLSFDEKSTKSNRTAKKLPATEVE